MNGEHDPRLEMLRHALATIAYRAGKALRDAPEEFATLRIAEGTRTPSEILAHVGDVLDWALSLAVGKQAWGNSEPLAWDAEVERFFAALERFDAYLASGNRVDAAPENLLQGPIADVLTHTGQLAMLRRLAGSPLRAENYFVAGITAGQVGAEQAPPRMEFA